MPSGRKLNGEYSGKVFQRGMISWNKGLKAENNPKIARSLEMAHAALRGKDPWNKENLSIKCVVCNKEFKINRYAVEKRGRKTCSLKCCYILRKGRKPWNKGINNVTRICKSCGKEFTFWGSKLKQGEVIYCSKQCYFPPIIKNCVVCNKEFKSSPSDKQKCCSKKCQLFISGFKLGFISWSTGKKRPEISGINHHNWKGGITPVNRTIRTSLEIKLWRKRVFERDNYICVKCGVRNGNGKKVILAADHIKRFAEYPELRFDLNNGQTLCKPCHTNKTKEEGKLYWNNQFLLKKNSII